jgi:hypothetical protein
VIDLPDWPRPNDATPSLVDWGAFLTPGLGGPVQRVNRMGSRFKISVSFPPLPSAKEGRIFVRRLVQGKSEGVRMRFPLLDFDPGAPGTIRINGAGQAGSTLVVDGATPNYVAREGQFFSIETSGKHHLYMVAAETIFSNTGTASVPITPMLRRPHLDNDLCHFGKPMIEGFIQGDEIGWNLSVERVISLQFDISESQ